MTHSRNLAVLATVAFLLSALASNAGASLIVNEVAGTFGIINVDAGNTVWFELTEGEVSQPDGSGLALVVSDIAVDLSGYSANGDSVAVVGGTVTIANPANSTTAVYNVIAANLTQMLTSPFGIGYVAMDLVQDNSDLNVAGESIILPSTLQANITYNGLVVGTDGSNGVASLNAPGSASFSAIPEPASFMLLLGGVALLRRFKK